MSYRVDLAFKLSCNSSMDVMNLGKMESIPAGDGQLMFRDISEGTYYYDHFGASRMVMRTVRSLRAFPNAIRNSQYLEMENWSSFGLTLQSILRVIDEVSCNKKPLCQLSLESLLSY